MPTILSSSQDGWVTRANRTSWADARDTSTGTSFSNLSVSAITSAAGQRYASRGGGYAYSVYRSFFQFDTSGIKRELKSGTLGLRGSVFWSGDIIALKATSDISTLSTADFAAIEGWSTGNNNTNSSVIKYTAQLQSGTTSDFNYLELTSQALKDMRNNDNLYVAVVEHDHDFIDVTPTTYTYRVGCFYADHATQALHPKIDYTYKQNSVFFGTNF